MRKLGLGAIVAILWLVGLLLWVVLLVLAGPHGINRYVLVALGLLQVLLLGGGLAALLFFALKLGSKRRGRGR